MDFSKMSKEQLMALYQSETASRKGGQAQAQPQQWQPDIASLLKKAQPSAGQSIANAMSVLGGGKAIYGNESNDLSKLYAQEAIKKQLNPYEDEYKQAQIKALTAKANAPQSQYFTLDEQGNAIPVPGYQPGMKPLPVGYTPAYQDAAKARTEFSQAGVPLRQAQQGLAEANTVAAQTGNDMMKQALGGGMNGQNSLPPGTTMKTGNMTIPLNRELTEGESKVIGNSEAMGSQMQKLREIISQPDSMQTQMLGSMPYGAGNEKAQRYQLIKNDLVDRLVRMRSGAQINEQEFARLSNLLPQALRNDSVDIEQLNTFDNEMKTILGRIKEGQNFQGGKQTQGIGTTSSGNKFRRVS